MSWTVVRFLKDDTVEAVPTNWIVGSSCFWPKEKILNKAIQSCQTPSDSWEKFQITRFKGSITYDDYKTARMKCKTAEVTSDLNSDSELKRVSRKPARFVPLSSSDSDDEGIQFPEIPKVSLLKAGNPGSKSLNLNNNCSVQTLSKETMQDIMPNLSHPTSAHNSELVEAPIESTAEVNVDHCSCCPDHKNITIIRMLQQLIRNVSLLEMNLYEVKRVIENTRIPDEISLDDIFEDFNLPLIDMQSFERFEHFLTEEGNMKKSILELAKVGGDTPEGFLKRAMQKLLTHSLAQQFSWLGLKHKLPLVKTKVANLLIRATQANQKTASVTTKSIEDSIKKILRRAKERAEAEERKKMNME